MEHVKIQTYVSPKMDVVEVLSEGVTCTSGAAQIVDPTYNGFGEEAIW